MIGNIVTTDAAERTVIGVIVLAPAASFALVAELLCCITDDNSFISSY